MLWQWSVEVPGLTPTHFYRADEGPQPPEPLHQEHFPWVVGQMRAGRRVAISSMEELPAEASVDLQNARLRGIRSSLSLPLSVGGEPPVGVLAFNALRTERDWPDPLVRRLQLVAQVFTNALGRKRRELKLQESEARLAAGADLAGLGFYEVDFEARVAYVDDRFRAVWACRRTGRQGFSPWSSGWRACIPTTARRCSTCARSCTTGALEQIAIEYRFLHPTQGERWIQHSARVSARDAAAGR